MASSKAVTIYNPDGTLYATFSGIRIMAKNFKCDHKTINKAIKNKSLFKNQWSLKLDNKESEVELPPLAVIISLINSKERNFQIIS